MQCMDELKVGEDSDRDTCRTGAGRPPIPTGWVDIDKGRLDQGQLLEQVGLSGDARAVNNLCGRLGNVCRNSRTRHSVSS